jgi:2'-5' RNA ligase
MRLFVGLALSDPVRHAAAAAANDLRRRLDAVDGQALRWVNPSNLHITLWFLGEVADGRLQDLLGALDRPFAVPSFQMRLDSAGLFPASGPPRALWLRVGAGSDSLRAAHAELASRLEPLGFEPERRAYSAHLTVARFKQVQRSAVADIRRVVRESPVAIGPCDVSAITLFRSRLSPKGSEYESLLRVPLA